MKGLDLAEQYFYEHGLPMLENHFGEQAHRVAAGLVGPGSECYGFDDHLSRDHDWGPGFCLWVDKRAYEQFGDKLQSAYERLPKKFKAFGPRQCSPGEDHRVGVIEIEQFYRTFTGLDHPPGNVQEWLRIPEEALSICTNGKVFQDPAGQFSSWRQHLKRYYPEDVRIYKIASFCVKVAQSGQYNFKRSLDRREWFALRYAEIQFCDESLSLTFLLNKCYAPFYKWSPDHKKWVPQTMSNRTDLITQILEAELNMLQSVPTCGPNRCLEYPEAFKLHREAQFSIFSTETLKSYMDDLTTARESNNNLMTYKYARMDNLIPRVNDSPLVDEVARIMIDWQLEMEDKYPEIMRRARPVTSENDNQHETSFETYLRGELETYSENTLLLLHCDLRRLLAEGKNGSEEIYRYLVQVQKRRETVTGQG